MAFGRFFCQGATSFLHPSLHLLEAIIITSFPLESLVPQSTFRDEWTYCWMAYKECSVSSTIFLFSDKAKSNMTPDLTQCWIVFPHQASLLIVPNVKKSKNKLVFLGHVINHNGISPDFNKTAAINQMNTSKSVSELWRFLGMINQLGEFPLTLPNSTKLLCTKRAWT